ncbi:unnamed protein product [Callosobruchus maculatus]|uniref:U-box domain-containing protein n=1 Tax=Callosobruchus maculatus TaxID=64391 RepID=A0A653DGF8_CALMS|nr:unnamed protein product [Callosobruchus maculatus]
MVRSKVVSTQMINFLDPKLCLKVNSTTPATDHYEAQNLVSGNYGEKSRGFIAYTIIRPPVEVDFQFICPVNIHYISINAVVGSHRSSGIEVFAKSGNSKYISICKAIFDEPGVIFCNSRKYTRSRLPPGVDKSYYVAFFKSDTFRNFLNADSIRVLIFRTHTRTNVPCLKSVEVWGVPARGCSLKTRETIEKLVGRTTPNTQSLLQCTSSNTNGDANETFIVPDEFKDDLTYEMMTVPMTLPSGKTVDQTTLEKHSQSEISLGRKPCDPFTGLKFDNKNKPVLNVGLKTRIDMFLLENSHRAEIFNLYRTTGGGQNAKVIQYSKRNCDCETSDAVDEAILKAKHNCNFISFSEDLVKINVCVNCKCEDKSLYKVPCGHLYCRNCILESSRSSKCQCGQTFSNSDVNKCYF